MGRRYREQPGPNAKQMYVERNKKGQFKDWVNINRSIQADTRRIAKTTVKPGHGHEGDLDTLKRRTLLEKIFSPKRKVGRPRKHHIGHMTAEERAMVKKLSQSHPIGRPRSPTSERALARRRALRRLGIPPHPRTAYSACGCGK